MSRLDELIEKLCPDGVEYKELGEVARYAKTRIAASKMNENNYVGVENLLQEKRGKTTASSVPAFGTVIAFERGDILIGNIRPYLKKIWLADCKGGTNGDVLTVQINDRSLFIPEYLYYVLSSDKFFLYDTQNSKGAKMPRGSKEAVMKYKLPVPPLPVQQEIVRILDSFTELEKELEKELELRRKQYEYYRDLLLNFKDVHAGGTNAYSVLWLADMLRELCPDGVEYKALGEFANISRGKIMSKDYLKENIGEYPVYSSQTENNGQMGSISTYMYDGEYLTWTTDGANAGTVFFRSGKFSITNVCGLIDVKNSNIIPKFLYYYLYKEAPNHVKAGMGNPKLMSNVMSNIKLPVPPLAVQHRIVHILDRFDTLCNDISSGIPAEIALRRKQYEYYRDKLLNFKELKEA